MITNSYLFLLFHCSDYLSFYSNYFNILNVGFSIMMKLVNLNHSYMTIYLFVIKSIYLFLNVIFVHQNGIFNLSNQPMMIFAYILNKFHIQGMQQSIWHKLITKHKLLLANKMRFSVCFGNPQFGICRMCKLPKRWLWWAYLQWICNCVAIVHKVSSQTLTLPKSRTTPSELSVRIWESKWKWELIQ